MSGALAGGGAAVDAGYSAAAQGHKGDASFPESSGGSAPSQEAKLAPAPETTTSDGHHDGDKSSEEESEDEELTAREEELRKDVPTLLETMNRTSGEVNTLERQLGEAQVRHRSLLEQLSRMHEELRMQYGSSIDRARPYFDAAEAFNAASARIQSAVGEFTAASTQHAQAKSELRAIEERFQYGAHKIALDNKQQDGLSRATVRVLRCQNERDARERDYAKALSDYQKAQEAVENWRSQIGDSTIRRALPCFRKLQQHQKNLAAEQNRINSLAEKAKAAKNSYNSSMSELDRISNAVHELRKDHTSRTAKQKASCPEKKSSGKMDEVGMTAAREAAPETEVPVANTCGSRDGSPEKGQLDDQEEIEGEEVNAESDEELEEQGAEAEEIAEDTMRHDGHQEGGEMFDEQFRIPSFKDEKKPTTPTQVGVEVSHHEILGEGDNGIEEVPDNSCE